MSDTAFRKVLDLPPPFDVSVQIPGEGDVWRTLGEHVSSGDRDEDYEPLGLASVVHHFFDPTHPTLKLTLISCLSPDWVLESVEPGHPAGACNSAFAMGQQQFSYPDARDRFQDALTAIHTIDRQRGVGLLFGTLGHAMHHLQDMAQPQHTRNDKHGGIGPLPDFALGPPSFYEGMIEATFGIAQVQPLTEPPAIPEGSVDGGIRTLWSDPQGSGLAQFSNRNFLSEGTKFKEGTLTNPIVDPNYLNPHYDQSTDVFEMVTWAQLEAEHPQELARAHVNATPPADSQITFIKKHLTDGSGFIVGDRVRLITYSALDEELDSHGKPPHFALNRLNLLDAGDVLLPRAAGYSAQLVNYFFRGVTRTNEAGEREPALRFRVLPAGVGDSLALEVTNKTGETWSETGSLQVCYDRRVVDERVCGPAIVLGQDLPPGGSVVLTPSQLDVLQLFREGPLVGEIAVFYRGPMGAETNAISARVCSCPAAGEDDPASPDSDCRALCPCQYLRTVEGDPGTVADGVVVAPADAVQQCFFGQCHWSDQFLTPLPPFALESYDNELGLALALVAADGRMDLHRVVGWYSASSASCASCLQSASSRGPNEATFEAFQVSGKNAVAAPFTAGDIASITGNTCGCPGGTFPWDSFWKLTFCYGANGNSCSPTSVPLDAVLACHGAP